MNWERIEGNWQQFKGKVKQRWGKLTDDQLTTINGQRDILAGRLQEAYGISKDEVDKQIRDWERSLADADTDTDRPTRTGTSR
jgi:uncharacterized protein YjbJ (UPF0337 family)